jgi:hypothetical protein
MNMHETVGPFSKQRIGKHTRIRVLWGAAPRLYNEDLRQLRIEFRESLEMAVEGDGGEKT